MGYFFTESFNNLSLSLSVSYFFHFSVSFSIFPLFTLYFSLPPSLLSLSLYISLFPIFTPSYWASLHLFLPCYLKSILFYLLNVRDIKSIWSIKNCYLWHHKLDRAERHCFWPQLWLFFSPFLLPQKKEGRRKG